MDGNPHQLPHRQTWVPPPSTKSQYMGGSSILSLSIQGSENTPNNAWYTKQASNADDTFSPRGWPVHLHPSPIALLANNLSVHDLHGSNCLMNPLIGSLTIKICLDTNTVGGRSTILKFTTRSSTSIYPIAAMPTFQHVNARFKTTDMTRTSYTCLMSSSLIKGA